MIMVMIWRMTAALTVEVSALQLYVGFAIYFYLQLDFSLLVGWKGAVFGPYLPLLFQT